MLSRLLRIAGSFTIVLVAYWAYAMAAVPLIEPRLERKPLVRNGESEGDAPVERRRSNDDVAMLFPEGAWERGKSVPMLEIERGRVFFGDYTTRPDGKIDISQFTMVMFPEGVFASEEERVRQAIVLQARKGAVLEFDQAPDLKRMKIGKLVGGKLQGEIIIRSDQKQPGPEDDLLIETRDVQLSESRIATPHEVAFRMGDHYGGGRQMTIELLPGDKAKQGKVSGPSVGGIRSFELAREVKLHLVPDPKQLSSSLKLGSMGNSGAAQQLLAPSPIEVTCRGPLKFDLVDGVATFRDQVDVVRVNSQGPSEKLTGELLAIHFANQDAAAKEGEQSPAGKKNPRLEPRRFEMQGDPVILESPANGISARGQRLEYDLVTRRASLIDSREAIVVRGTDEIRALELHYEPGGPGRLGRFLAVGPGSLRGTSPDSGQPVEANWTNELRIGVDPEFPQNDVVSLIGAATVRVPGMGGIHADKIYAWVRRLPKPGINGMPGPPGEDAAPKGRLVPDRMLAVGKVDIDAPQLVGDTGQLEVWFEHLPPLPLTPSVDPIAMAQPQPPGPRATNVSSASPAAAMGPQQALPNSDDSTWRASTGLRTLSRPGGGDSQQQFGVHGNLLRLRLNSRGEDTQVAEVDLYGDAKLEELRTAKPGDKPLLVEGDRLHLQQPAPEQATIVVTGSQERLGHVEAQGMGLNGKEIVLDQARNELRIDGPGLMTILADRDLQGRPTAKPEQLEVRWQGGLLFDGQIATFDRRVVAKRQTQQLNTELLTISLSARVSFGDNPGKIQPQVAKIACSGGMRMNGETFDEQGLLSFERVEMRSLSINQLTGDVTGEGPGWMRQVRRGGGEDEIGIPGLAPAKPPADAPAGPAKLSYRHVTFERELTGNLQRRELSFGDQVKTVYGEVDDWEDHLDPGDGLGERDFVLLCDRLRINEMPGAQGKRNLEMMAEGNTSIEGETFHAKGARLSYAAGKELVTLEGDGRADATLTRQQRVGGKPSTVAMRRIIYNRVTRQLELNGVSGGDINELPATKK